MNRRVCAAVLLLACAASAMPPDERALAVRYAENERGERRLVGTLMAKEGSRWQSVSVDRDAVGIVPAR